MIKDGIDFIPFKDRATYAFAEDWLYLIFQSPRERLTSGYWRADGNGYTAELKEAGRYSFNTLTRVLNNEKGGQYLHILYFGVAPECLANRKVVVSERASRPHRTILVNTLAKPTLI